MSLEQEPFRRYNLEKKTDTFTIKLNEKERAEFNQYKRAIHQQKDSTAIKQLAWIGAKVVLEKKTAKILETIMNNYRKNKRLGVVEFDENPAKVTQMEGEK